MGMTLNSTEKLRDPAYNVDSEITWSIASLKSGAEIRLMSNFLIISIYSSGSNARVRSLSGIVNKTSDYRALSFLFNVLRSKVIMIQACSKPIQQVSV